MHGDRDVPRRDQVLNPFISTRLLFTTILHTDLAGLLSTTTRHRLEEAHVNTLLKNIQEREREEEGRRLNWHWIKRPGRKLMYAVSTQASSLSLSLSSSLCVCVCV